jgi:hypothetical protein
MVNAEMELSYNGRRGILKQKGIRMHQLSAGLAILLGLMTVVLILNIGHMVALHNNTPSPLRAYRSDSSRALFLPSSYQLETASFDRVRSIHHNELPSSLSEGTTKKIFKERHFIVRPGDYIYDKQSWDSSPIVIESHKLVFFSIAKAGCTVWKQLFRRMMGYSDWLSQDGEKMLPHNPRKNGLKYLDDYSIEQASDMMTSPEWTRAMMVREPKQRFLSAFLDKAVSNYHRHIVSHCCPDESCVENAQTLAGFLKLATVCQDDHWRPQNLRVDYKYWPYIDFVGHVENAAADARTLLKRIGAWEEYGETGWGKSGNSSIFESKDTSGAGVHATWASMQVWKWYTPEVEAEVETFYRGDYENPLFNFTHDECLTCTTDRR